MPLRPECVIHGSESISFAEGLTSSIPAAIEKHQSSLCWVPTFMLQLPTLLTCPTMFLLLMNLLMLQRLYIDHIRPIPLQILVLIVLLVIWNEKLDLSQDTACNEARTHGDRKIAITSIAVDSGFTNAVHASLQLSCMLVHEWAMIECFIDSTLPQGLQVRGALRRGWGVDANHARGARHIGQA